MLQRRRIGHLPTLNTGSLDSGAFALPALLSFPAAYVRKAVARCPAGDLHLRPLNSQATTSAVQVRTIAEPCSRSCRKQPALSEQGGRPAASSGDVVRGARGLRLKAGASVISTQSAGDRVKLRRPFWRSPSASNGTNSAD